MILSSYFDSIADGIQFLIAIGSVIGFLGFIAGLLGVIFGGKYRVRYFGLLIISLVLCVCCGGPGIGIKYFHIH